jgi:hypothetical protein
VLVPGGMVRMGCLAPPDAPDVARPECGLHLRDADTRLRYAALPDSSRSMLRHSNPRGSRRVVRPSSDIRSASQLAPDRSASDQRRWIVRPVEWARTSSTAASRTCRAPSNSAQSRLSPWCPVTRSPAEPNCSALRSGGGRRAGVLRHVARADRSPRRTGSAPSARCAPADQPEPEAASHRLARCQCATITQGYEDNDGAPA